MRKFLLTVFVVALAHTAHAAELVQFTDGSTAFRDNSGFTFGHNGGNPNSSSGYNDVKTGERYERINNDQTINTSTGQPMNDHREKAAPRSSED